MPYRHLPIEVIHLPLRTYEVQHAKMLICGVAQQSHLHEIPKLMKT